MRISPKRLILSASDVINTINANIPKKLDLSFVNNVIKMDDLKLEFELMKTRNLPLLRSVYQAVERGDIVMCRADNVSSSIGFAFGVDKDTNTINKVFVNLVRYIKVSNGVDTEGNLNNKMEIIGGFEVLYNLLLSAYVALKTEKIFNSPTVVSSMCELYTDIFSQLISRGFANPIDGEKFRFIVKYFFFNGKVKPEDLAESTRYGIDKYRALEIKHGDFFSGRELSLEDLCNTIVAEFPPIAKTNLNIKDLIIAAITGLGDSGVYILDNMPYLVAVMVAKLRRGRMFNGYMLKMLERDQTILSKMYQAIG
jgi:hypothetical protein|uniref:Uncharacterized protein n=1 Tax=Myoviridae sp. ctkfK18 TaxID=2825165 RepID=A0A8S5VGW9_9CAUD|nr:MAG TPA: hypothetical protein [Myoviridae sp. ctkfK18]